MLPNDAERGGDLVSGEIDNKFNISKRLYTNTIQKMVIFYPVQ